MLVTPEGTVNVLQLVPVKVAGKEEASAPLVPSEPRSRKAANSAEPNIERLRM
jgi:hypothetical protein